MAGATSLICSRPSIRSPELASRRDLVATAIFWHDAVYVTRAADGTRRTDAVNVLDSAELFRQHSLLSAADADAVHELIMATTDHLGAKPCRGRYPGFGHDLDLFVDLTLVLASASNFDAIRHEFSPVPEPLTWLRALSLKPCSPTTVSRPGGEAMAEKGAREHRALLGRPQSEPRSLTRRQFDHEGQRSKARELPSRPKVCGPNQRRTLAFSGED